VKDGEINNGPEEKGDEEGANPRDRFQHMVQEWSWGSEPGLEQFEEAIQELTSEQYLKLSREACQTQFLSRLKQRLAIMERYFVSLARKGISSHKRGSLTTSTPSEKPKAKPVPSTYVGSVLSFVCFVL